jgi:hypothetical protein
MIIEWKILDMHDFISMSCGEKRIENNNFERLNPQEYKIRKGKWEITLKVISILMLAP